MTFKKSVIVAVLFMVCFSSTVFCAGKAKVQIGVPGDVSVSVELHLISVVKQGLVESGVKPISMDHQEVSMLNILWCLDHPKKAGFIVSQMKVASQNNSFSEVRSEDTISYSSGKEEMFIAANRKLSAKPYIYSTSKVKVTVDYEFEGFAKSGIRIKKFSWKGEIIVKPGVPQIVAAMEGFNVSEEVDDDDDIITFLVITATIQGQSGKTTANKYGSETKNATDIDRMQGTWKGKELRASGGQWTLVIDGDQIQADGPGPEDYSGTIVTDETTAPKSARFKVNICAFKQYVGTVANNIYKFEGEKLILAGTEPGSGTKPTSFKPGNGTRVFELEKVK